MNTNFSIFYFSLLFLFTFIRATQFSAISQLNIDDVEWNK